MKRLIALLIAILTMLFGGVRQAKEQETSPGIALTADIATLEPY